MKRLQLLAIFVVGFVICLEAANSRRDKDRKKDRFKMSSGSVNPCSDEDPDGPIHCFCRESGIPGNVTSAECWVFTKELTMDYPVWSYFASQPHITIMTLLVKGLGQITFVPTNALKYMTKLQVFRMTYGTIDEVHPYAFANLSQLQEIKLMRNQIINLGYHSFAHLPNLTEVNLDDNRISELHKDVFVDLPNLQKLFITKNNLSFLQETTFRDLGHLLELDLNQNYISVLTKDTFAGLGGLKRLDLSSNNISMLGDLTFSELWVLEVFIIFFLIKYNYLFKLLF